MAFPINKKLVVNIGPFGAKKMDIVILEQVEKLLGRPVDWVDYKLINEDKKKMTRTYFIREACNYRDKDRQHR
jgi:hypothetical protein